MAAKDFVDVFEAETKAINARRDKFLELYPPPAGGVTAPNVSVDTVAKDERGHRIGQPSEGHRLTGLALSGGGVRSAAFCLGVLQGLDAQKPNGSPQVLDAFDYLSTVSGGGFTGTALTAGIMQSGGAFPFESKLDQQETIELQHIRDYSNYLMPKGGRDLVVGVVAVVRGLLLNAIVFLGLILVCAAATTALNRTPAGLLQPWGFDAEWKGYAFVWTGVALVIFLLSLAVSPLRSPFLEEPGAPLADRELMWRVAAAGVSALVLVAVVDAQGYVLAGIFSAPGSEASGNYVTEALRGLGTALSKGWVAVLTGATGLVASIGKLTSVVRATTGDATWTGSTKRWASIAAVYLTAAVAPLLIWATYLMFSYWGIGQEGGELNHLHAPAWLRSIASHFGNERWGFPLLYGSTALLCLVLSVFIRPNAGSLHGYYRDRLSRAFLWQRDRLLDHAAGRASTSQVTDVDRFTFSSLGKAEVDGTWPDSVRFAPYLLVNTAVNLEGSEYLNRRGRNADNFIFSPLFTGSAATGYVETGTIEAVDRHVNLATAMAASGAAASANMGASTIKALTFTLSAANVRLGYWIPNPRLAGAWKDGKAPFRSKIGVWYFAKEALGLVDETTRNVYLTDGGHFDNLGLYELLKRRCAVIVAVDAEADPPLNFESLVRLQRYARIDLGVRIDLPWEDIRRFAKKITVDFPHGPLDDAARCHGPHVAVGRIEYGPKESGVLIYIKATMSGDENDLVRDYKRRNTEFPHETTLDQFFSEEQFEVYRTLGFHAAKSFFSGEDRFGVLQSSDYPGWTDEVEGALLRLNLGPDAVARIVRRQKLGRPVR